MRGERALSTAGSPPAAGGFALPSRRQRPFRVSALSFNILGGNPAAGRGLADTIAVIRAAGADVVGLQETYRQAEDARPGTIAREIAAELGLHVHEQPRGGGPHRVSAILSRWPIAATTPLGFGVRINAGPTALFAFNLHLPPAPYQPYQLLGIPYGDAPPLATADEAVAAADAARGHVIGQLAEDMTAAGGAPAIVTGDFNEPSHLDWTARASAAGLHPLAAPWPASRRLAGLGFVDCFRHAHPDEVARPGFTWTTDPGEPEKHDRIDFVFARGGRLRVDAAEVLGEARPAADRALTPWPSDHRAVLARLSFAGGGGTAA
jgi:endonuclease/exonuclease/phosphatase family metal-dependent hydrolase